MLRKMMDIAVVSGMEQEGPCIPAHLAGKQRQERVDWYILLWSLCCCSTLRMLIIFRVSSCSYIQFVRNKTKTLKANLSV